MFSRTFFTGCKFIDCSLKKDLLLFDGSDVHFYGCEDYHTGFISLFKQNQKVEIEANEQASLEIQILGKYFKVDGRSTKMKYISYLKGEFSNDKIEEVFSVFHALRKKNFIQVKGNNSFITQLGINYYHKHTS